MHLPVIFTGSLSKASEVSFNPTNCPELAGQINVQTAIEALCKIQHAGCATYVVDPDGDWTQVLTRLKPNEDAHICFQRGEFKAAQPISLKGLGHIRLTGAGAGSRVLVSQHEIVLDFENCKSISIEHLSLATSDDDNLPHLTHLNGVLNVRDCPLVSIRNVGVECGTGLTTERACITIRSTDGAKMPLEWVQVQGCDLSVGHDQYGLLVMDAKHMDIEGNRIRTAPYTFTWEKYVAVPQRAKKLVRQLVANGIYRETLSINSGELRFDVGAFAILLNSAVPRGEWLKLIEQVPPTPADKVSKEAVEAYAQRLVAVAIREPTRLPSYGKQLSQLQRAIGEDRFRNLPQEVSRNLLISQETSVKPFTEVEKQKRTTALVFSDRRLLFDSELSSADWQAILSSDGGTAPRSNAELYRAVNNVAKRIVSEKAYRDRFAPAREWYEKLRAKATQGVSRCGIVCGGRFANNVRIERNSIEGSAEAIHVAFSHHTGKDAAADYAEDISIRDNNIRLRVPWELKTGLYGLFVGNVRHLVLANNKLATDKPYEQSPKFEEGIRVWGNFGMVLALRDNVVQDAKKGIVVRAEGILEQPNHQKKVNWQLSGMWTDGIIEVPDSVKRRDNIPEP